MLYKTIYAFVSLLCKKCIRLGVASIALLVLIVIAVEIRSAVHVKYYMPEILYARARTYWDEWNGLSVYRPSTKDFVLFSPRGYVGVVPLSAHSKIAKVTTRNNVDFVGTNGCPIRLDRAYGLLAQTSDGKYCVLRGGAETRYSSDIVIYDTTLHRILATCDLDTREREIIALGVNDTANKCAVRWSDNSVDLWSVDKESGKSRQLWSSEDSSGNDNRVLTLGGFSFSDASISFVQSIRENRLNVVSYSLDTGAVNSKSSFDVHILRDAGKASGISPDGKAFSFGQEDSDKTISLAVYDTQSSSERLRLTDSELSLRSPIVFSRDCTQIAYIRSSTRLMDNRLPGVRQDEVVQWRREYRQTIVIWDLGSKSQVFEVVCSSRPVWQLSIPSPGICVASHFSGISVYPIPMERKDK